MHAIFFLPMPELKKPKQSQIKELKLSYLRVDAPLKKRTAKFRYKKIKPEDKQSLIKKQLNAKLPKNKAIKKKSLNKITSKKVEKIITKPDNIVKIQSNNQLLASKDELEKKDLFKNKSYISYYKLINEQLRQSVIYPSHFSEGEIGLSFVLGSDGKLKNVQVINSTSKESEILKETAMQIVKRASPFPPFPKNLQQTQLTFNIVFCFKENS